MKSGEKDKRELDVLMNRQAAMTEGEFQKIVDETKKAWEGVGNGLLVMGKNYIRCLSAGEEWATRFRESNPDVGATKWELLALAGMGKIAPKMVVYSNTGYNLLKRLPVADQERLLTKPIDVLVIDEKGKTDTIKAEFKNLTNDQQKQVVGYDHIKTLSEQRIHLEQRRTTEWTKTAAPENKRYVISGREIIFPAKSKFTESEIWAIAKEMAGVKK